VLAAHAAFHFFFFFFFFLKRRHGLPSGGLISVPLPASGNDIHTINVRLETCAVFNCSTDRQPTRLHRTVYRYRTVCSRPLPLSFPTCSSAVVDRLSIRLLSLDRAPLPLSLLDCRITISIGSSIVGSPAIAVSETIRGSSLQDQPPPSPAVARLSAPLLSPVPLPLPSPSPSPNQPPSITVTAPSTVVPFAVLLPSPSPSHLPSLFPSTVIKASTINEASSSLVRVPLLKRVLLPNRLRLPLPSAVCPPPHTYPILTLCLRTGTVTAAEPPTVTVTDPAVAASPLRIFDSASVPGVRRFPSRTIFSGRFSFSFSPSSVPLVWPPFYLRLLFWCPVVWAGSYFTRWTFTPALRVPSIWVLFFFFFLVYPLF